MMVRPRTVEIVDGLAGHPDHQEAHAKLNQRFAQQVIQWYSDVTLDRTGKRVTLAHVEANPNPQQWTEFDPVKNDTCCGVVV